MLPAFLIMLREGLEAALITSIIAGYLARTGRAKAMGGIWLGVILAVLVSLAAGLGLHQWADEFPEDQYALFEGLVSLVAAALLITMVFWMRRAARSLRSDLHAAVDRTLAGTATFWPLVTLAFLAVVREGLESAFFLLALVQQAGTGLALLGAALGLALAVVLGLALYRGSLALDLRAFFRWTGAFIVVVAAGLVGTAVHEFAELGLWTFLPQPAYDLRAVLPRDGLPGSILSGLIGYRDHGSLGEMLVYLGFLATALTLYFWPHPQLPARSTS